MRPPPAPTDRPKPRVAEVLGAGLIAAFFALFGWFTLWQGGVSLKDRSGRISFVEGLASQAMAGLFFFSAAMGLLVLLKIFAPSRRAVGLVLAVLLVPPLVFVVVQRWK